MDRLDKQIDDGQAGMGLGKKKEKQERYLTVQGLLNHPYFISINEADIAVIIDEFERFTQSYWLSVSGRSDVIKINKFLRFFVLWTLYIVKSVKYI